MNARLAQANLIANADFVAKLLSLNRRITPTTSDNTLTPALNYYGPKTRVKFTGSCFKQTKISYSRGKNNKYLHRL